MAGAPFGDPWGGGVRLHEFDGAGRVGGDPGSAAWTGAIANGSAAGGGAAKGSAAAGCAKGSGAGCAAGGAGAGGGAGAKAGCAAGAAGGGASAGGCAAGGGARATAGCDAGGAASLQRSGALGGGCAWSRAFSALKRAISASRASVGAAARGATLNWGAGAAARRGASWRSPGARECPSSWRRRRWRCGGGRPRAAPAPARAAAGAPRRDRCWWRRHGARGDRRRRRWPPATQALSTYFLRGTASGPRAARAAGGSPSLLTTARAKFSWKLRCRAAAARAPRRLELGQ